MGPGHEVGPGPLATGTWELREGGECGGSCRPGCSYAQSLPWTTGTESRSVILRQPQTCSQRPCFSEEMISRLTDSSAELCDRSPPTGPGRGLRQDAHSWAPEATAPPLPQVLGLQSPLEVPPGDTPCQEPGKWFPTPTSLPGTAVQLGRLFLIVGTGWWTRG